MMMKMTKAAAATSAAADEKLFITVDDDVTALKQYTGDSFLLIRSSVVGSHGDALRFEAGPVIQMNIAALIL